VTRYIDEHATTYGVEPICRTLAIAPSSYYAARSRPPSARTLCTRVALRCRSDFVVLRLRRCPTDRLALRTWSSVIGVTEKLVWLSSNDVRMSGASYRPGSERRLSARMTPATTISGPMTTATPWLNRIHQSLFR
jgi:hypothetical protein